MPFQSPLKSNMQHWCRGTKRRIRKNKRKGTMLHCSLMGTY